jgi:hypothetical protein
VACVLETGDGRIVCQRDSSAPEGTFDRHFTVIFQRGMLKNPRVPRRASESARGPYRVQLPTGRRVEVFSRHISYDPFYLAPTPTPSCGACMSPSCVRCLKGIAEEHIAVLSVRQRDGSRAFKWFTRLDADPCLLVPVPLAFAEAIVARLGPELGCTCGLCQHPLRELRMTRSGLECFEREAARRLQRYARALRRTLREERGGRARACAKRRMLSDLECALELRSGECAVCLQEGQVSFDSCSNSTCKIGLCASCIVQTRGICPICDRAKLGSNASFLCLCCSRAVPLDSHGFACISCRQGTLCVQCYRDFGQCADCEIGEPR